MLYPLQLETVREANIERWIAECEKARLVRLYNSDGKPILEIIKFRQSIRAASSKFPAFDEQTHSRSAAEISQIVENQPPSKNATQMHSKCIADALLVGGVVGVVGVSVGEGEAPHHSPHLEKLQGWQLRKDLRETTDPKEIAAIKAEMKRREQAHRKPKPTTAPAAKQETQAMTIEQRKRLWDEAKKTHKI